MTNLLALARTAAGQVQGETNVGDFIESVKEAEAGTETYYFACKMKGYPDWRWAATLFTDAETGKTTVSEVNLMPGETSLQAPKWVPWSERLADYKALQAALEEQAKAEAEEAAAAAALNPDAAVDGEDSDEDDEILEVEEDEESEGLATTLGDESEDSESDSDDASGEPKGFFRYKFLRRHKKRK